jgi:hypothetical protein
MVARWGGALQHFTVPPSWGSSIAYHSCQLVPFNRRRGNKHAQGPHTHPGGSQEHHKTLPLARVHAYRSLSLFTLSLSLSLSLSLCVCVCARVCVCVCVCVCVWVHACLSLWAGLCGGVCALFSSVTTFRTSRQKAAFLG